MPKIPRYTRQQSITGKASSVTSPGFQGEAQALGHLADFAQEIAVEKERIEKEEQHYSTLRLGNEVNELSLGFEQERLNLQGTDAYNSMQAVDEWERSTKEKFLSNIPDQKVSRDVDLHISAQAIKLKNTLARHESNQRDYVAEDTRIKTLESSTKSAYQGSGTLENNLQVYRNAIVNDPRLRDSDKENKIMAGESSIAGARLDGMIDRNPQAALELIESGMFNEYLDTKQLKHFQGEADKAVKDIDRAIKQRDKEAEEALKEQQEETGNEFHQMLIDGELDYRTIANSPLDVTGENSKEYWRKQLDKIAKAKTAPDQDTIEADLTSRILADPNGETEDAVTDEVLREAVANGLKPTKARTIRNFRDKVQEDPLKTDQAKTAIATLNAAKTADMFSDDELENVKMWGESTRLLKKFIENHPEEDPQVFIDQLMEKSKDSWIRRKLDILPWVDQAETADQRKARLEAEAGITPESQPKEVPENAAYSGKNPATGKMEYFDAEGNKING